MFAGDPLREITAEVPVSKISDFERRGKKDNRIKRQELPLPPDLEAVTSWETASEFQKDAFHH